jgi:hypothetical protein
METKPHPGFLARLFRPLTFPVDASFTTSLSLDECRAFLMKPVPPQRWVLKKTPLRSEITLEVGAEGEKLDFAVVIFVGPSDPDKVRSFLGYMVGKINSDGDGCHITYTSQISQFYGILPIGVGLYFLIRLYIEWSQFVNLPSYLFQFPTDWVHLGIQLMFLFGIFLCGIGIFYMVKIRPARRNILNYLEASLKGITV